MANCIHCDGPMLIKSVRVGTSAQKFIHEECYKSLCTSFFFMAKRSLTTRKDIPMNQQPEEV